ncbi:MAG: hypothetical protein WC820_04330, partial [Spirochaetales bacterium]
MHLIRPTLSATIHKSGSSMEVAIIFSTKGDGGQKKTRTNPGFLRKVGSSLRGLLFFLGNDEFLDLGFLA